MRSLKDSFKKTLLYIIYFCPQMTIIEINLSRYIDNTWSSPWFWTPYGFLWIIWLGNKIFSLSHKTDLNIFTELLKDYWPQISVTSIKSMYISSTLVSLPELSDSLNFLNCTEFFSLKSFNSFEGVTLNNCLWEI